MLSPGRPLVKCAVCQAEFDPIASIGRWECRTHAARELVMDDENRLVYPCCSLSYEDNITAFKLNYMHLSPLELIGCIAADHVHPETVRATPPPLPYRETDDIYLLSDVTHSNPFAAIPDEAIIQGPQLLTYGDLERLADDRIVGKRLTVPVYNSVAKRMELRRIDVSLRTQARSVLARAYAQPDLYKTDAKLQAKRDKVLRDRPTLRARHGLHPQQIAFLESVKNMSDDDFIVEWFTKQEKEDIAVNLCVVRAVAPVQDKLFLRRLADQRAYVKRKQQ